MTPQVNNKIIKLYEDYIGIQMDRHEFFPSGEQLNDLYKLLPYTRKMSMDELKREAINYLTFDEFKEQLKF